MGDTYCMLCRASITGDVNNENYVQHLFRQHNVIFKADFIVQETFKGENNDTNNSEEGTKLSGLVVKKIPWFAGCEYVCKFQNCGKMYFYEKFLQDHISKVHCSQEFNLENYIAIHSQYETKAVFMDCRLCGKALKRQWDSVTGHLSNDHEGVSLVDYTKKFNIDDEYQVSSMKLPSKEECNKYNYIIYSLKANSEPFENGKIVEARNNQDPENTRRRTDDRNVEHSTNAEDSNANTSKSPVLPWYCKSEFRCGACSEFFYDVKSLISHGAVNHMMKKKEYCERFKDTFPNLSKYACQICKEEIKHQYSSIATHLSTEHDTSMEAYGAKYHSDISTKGLKREIDDLSEDSHSSKRANTGQNGKLKIKTESMINLPWYSGTEFKCAMCTEVYFDIMDLTTHVDDNHNISNDKYRDQYEDTYPSLKYYECQVCTTEIKHQHSSISRHVMKEHTLSMEDYGYKFHNDRKDDIDSIENKKRKDGIKIKKENMKMTEDDPGEELEDELPWYCKNKFGCSLCSQKFCDVISLMNHASAKHGLSKDEYGDQFDGRIPDLSYYTCQICSMEIKHQYSSLSKHINNEHKIDMKSYETKFHLTSSLKIRDAFSVNVKKEDPPIPEESPLDDTTTEKHDEENYSSDESDTTHETEEPKTKSKSKNRLRVKIPPKSLRSRRIEPSESPSNTEQEIENFDLWSLGKCEYDCKICDFTSAGSTIMWTHIKDTHDLDIEGYKTKYGDPCTVMRKLKCNGCNKSVRHDSAYLKKHAKNEHSMMLKRFYETFFKATKEIEIKVESQEVTDVENTSSSDEDNTQENFASWAKGSCKYHCKICLIKSDTSSNIWYHIKTVHELQEDEYRKRHGDPCSVLKMIQCKACYKMILHDPNPLQKHAVEDHEMSLKTFYDTFFRPLDNF